MCVNFSSFLPTEISLPSISLYRVANWQTLANPCAAYILTVAKAFKICLYVMIIRSTEENRCKYKPRGGLTRKASLCLARGRGFDTQPRRPHFDGGEVQRTRVYLDLCARKRTPGGQN